MAGSENTNLALDQQSPSSRPAAIVTGAKGGKRVVHPWYGLWETFEGALVPPGFVGFGDEFLGGAVDGKWQQTKSNSGTLAVNAQSGGAIRLTTDTGASDLVDIALSLSFLVSNGWTVFRARTKQVTATTNRIIEVGLGDTIAPAGGLAFSDPSVPTAVDTNAAVFGFKDGSMTTYSAISVNAGGTPQAVLAVATPSTSYQLFSIEIDSAGNAYFYLGDPPVLVATILLAVATTAVLTPWVAIKNTTAAAHSMDVDMISIHQPRV